MAPPKIQSYFSSHNAEPRIIQPGNCPWRILVRLAIICATSYPGLCEDPLPWMANFPLPDTDISAIRLPSVTGKEIYPTPLFKYCQRRICSWYPDTPLPPSPPPPPYTPSPAATLCCPWCFIISLGVCGPPLLSFDGVQTVKAWRQPANFPRCDSPPARGHAIFPLHWRRAYVPPVWKLSTCLVPLHTWIGLHFVSLVILLGGFSDSLISTLWGRGCCSGLCCAAAGGWHNGSIYSLS